MKNTLVILTLLNKGNRLKQSLAKLYRKSYNIMYNTILYDWRISGMTVKNYTYVRDNFRDMINKVNEDSDTVTITTKDHNAVLMSESDYDSIMETLYLQQSPANAKHLEQSIADLERGNAVTKEIDV